jgi:hypothetical protein
VPLAGGVRDERHGGGDRQRGKRRARPQAAQLAAVAPEREQDEAGDGHHDRQDRRLARERRRECRRGADPEELGQRGRPATAAAGQPEDGAQPEDAEDDAGAGQVVEAVLAAVVPADERDDRRDAPDERQRPGDHERDGPPRCGLRGGGRWDLRVASSWLLAVDERTPRR